MHGTSRQALTRLRVRAWPILQTAVAAVAAWYLARLLLPERQPVFASIAAVVALGATYGQRSERALELIGGVVLGIGVADLLVRAIGNGPAQIGVMVLLAMSAAVLLGAARCSSRRRRSRRSCSWCSSRPAPGWRRVALSRR